MKIKDMLPADLRVYFRPQLSVELAEILHPILIAFDQGEMEPHEVDPVTLAFCVAQLLSSARAALRADEHAPAPAPAPERLP